MEKEMIMDNKYFTPSIEDIRVRYECEWKTKGEWENLIAHNPNHVASIYYTLSTPFMDGDHIRVPYLTKEQLESEGWTHNGHLLLADVTDDKKLGDENIYGFNKNGFHIVFHNEKRVITITKENNTLFKGECKDINTFRYICKLLGIQ